MKTMQSFKHPNAALVIGELLAEDVETEQNTCD